MPENGSGKILILEDDAGIAQLERRKLERAGYCAEVAPDAEQARAALARGGVDLLLLDYYLNASSDGLEFYRELREGGLNVPSILVTGRSDEAMLTLAIRSGIRDFLPKSAEFLDFLVPSVDRVMGQIRVERELEEARARVFREQAARAEAEAERRALTEEDRRKDEFLAMLAHELRNPLSAISSAVHLARRESSVEQTVWSNDVITRQVGHLTHLIDDLLDVSRIRLGKIHLRKTAVDVSESVARAVEVVRPLIDRKSHGLTVAVAPGPLLVEADPTRMEQIVVNLLTNAAKYTDEGGRITLSADREGESIAIRVIDTGVGISAEMLPKIFDLFIQVDGSLDRSQGGLGIGLTLVQKLVSMHGGAVAVASDGPGKGSVFTVLLPAIERSVATVAPAPAAAPAPRRSRRVLVVDDNADSARGMAPVPQVRGARGLPRAGRTLRPGPRPRVRPRGRRARHRPARDGRLPGRLPPPRRRLPLRHHHRRLRLRPGRGPPKVPRRRVRPPPGQARGPRRVAGDHLGLARKSASSRSGPSGISPPSRADSRRFRGRDPGRARRADELDRPNRAARPSRPGLGRRTRARRIGA